MHSSCASISGDQVYVACGSDEDDNPLGSVEMFRLEAQAWELIDIPDLTPRYLPVLVQIDASICILGGIDDEE